VKEMKLNKKTLLLLLILFPILVNAASEEEIKVNHGFPRLMGINIGNKAYDDPLYRKELSKVDVLIISFYPGWGTYKGVNAEQRTVAAIKQLNPTMLVGQYTMLGEAPASDNEQSASTDIGRKIDENNWWLRNAEGERVQWTNLYNKWDVNITEFMSPDGDGLYYPQWLARRDYNIYFENNSEFDIWYFDNALSRSPVKLADWNQDRRNDLNTHPDVARAYRMGNIAEWEEAKKLNPNLLLLGNSDDISSVEYQNQLHGVLMEAVIGKSWSMVNWYGWDGIMKRYRTNMKYTLGPHLVGFNIWGESTDYQGMRYGLASCLLDNGYFSYTDNSEGYSSVPWFDEFDVDLGLPVDPPAERVWNNGVYRRLFERGMVLVNPGEYPKTVRIEPGYKKIKGGQDPVTNNGGVVTTLTLKGKDGVILLKYSLEQNKPVVNPTSAPDISDFNFTSEQSQSTSEPTSTESNSTSKSTSKQNDFSLKPAYGGGKSRSSGESAVID